MKDGYFLMLWPALAMVSINGYTGGAIKVIYNTFNGDVNSTKKTTYAISAGGALQNFEWTCNSFNDFETAVIYSGNGPVQNPASAGDANNTYTNISNWWVENASSTTPLTYSCTYAALMNANSLNVIATSSGGEPSDCSVNCTSIQTKYKHSPTASLAPPLSKGEMTVYPNPTTGAITLDFGIGKSGQMTIYNAQGQQVRQATVQSGVQYTEGKVLPTGLYFIEVFSDGDKRTSKLIISN